MNERIKQLAEQATSMYRHQYDPKTMMTERIQEFDKEKFAELIVQECIDILDDEDDGSHDGRSVRIAAIRIKKLFGVEE